MHRDKIMHALFEFYCENGTDRSMDYTYGFFDALGVIRDLLENDTPDSTISAPIA